MNNFTETHSKKDEPSSQPNSDEVHQNINAHVQ